MRLTSMEVTFLYSRGGYPDSPDQQVNIQKKYNIEFEQGEDVAKWNDLIKWETDKVENLLASGAMPAVRVRGGGKDPRTYNYQRQKEKGREYPGAHPNDLEPALGANGKQLCCPKCDGLLVLKDIRVKKGKPDEHVVKNCRVHAVRTDKCNFIEWGQAPKDTVDHDREMERWGR